MTKSEFNTLFSNLSEQKQILLNNELDSYDCGTYSIYKLTENNVNEFFEGYSPYSILSTNIELSHKYFVYGDDIITSTNDPLDFIDTDNLFYIYSKHQERADIFIEQNLK